MPSNQIDMSAQLKAFPYISPVVVDPSRASASEIDQLIAGLEAGSSQIPTDITDLIGPGAVTVGAVGRDEWKRTSIASLSWVGDIIDPLEKSLKAIGNIVTLLSKILRIIELFTSTFNSFSKLIISAIELAQNKLSEFGLETMGFGVYANVLVPPALLKMVGNVDSRNQLRGGFQGFLTRLESSVNNVQDLNRPNFTLNDYVGGLVIVLDTDSLDDAWKGLKQLAAMFDFMQLFGLNLAPPPPTNLTGFSGRFFVDDEGNIDVQDAISRAKELSEGESLPWRFGVQLEWDNTYTASGYNIYRSKVPGGTAQLVEYYPSTLVDNKETGEPGLLTIISDWIMNIRAKESVQLPEREERVYDDVDFGGPHFIQAGLNTRLKFIDTFMTTKVLNPEASVEDRIEIPVTTDGEGKEVPVTNYYYIIKACGLGGLNEGPNSKELSVAIKTCNDAFSIADLIAHPNGQLEFFSTGFGKINNWSSIKLTAMVPWFTEIVGLLNDFLETLKGMVTDASDSFQDFLGQIQAKVQMYTNILGAVSYLVEKMGDFVLGSSIAFLNVDPVKGGMPVFLQRVRNAKVPDEEEFSGSEGITVGIVLVYGASGGRIAQLGIMKRAFDFIHSIFVR